MVKILEKVGCSVHYNVEQTCCGQPAYHSGHWDDCKEVGEKLIKEFIQPKLLLNIRKPNGVDANHKGMNDHFNPFFESDIKAGHFFMSDGYDP